MASFIHLLFMLLLLFISGSSAEKNSSIFTARYAPKCQLSKYTKYTDVQLYGTTVPIPTYECQSDKNPRELTDQPNANDKSLEFA